MTNINELLRRIDDKKRNATEEEDDAAQVIREQQDALCIAKLQVADRDELESKLALAVEALSKLNEHYYADNGKSLIRETLAKLKEKV